LRTEEHNWEACPIALSLMCIKKCTEFFSVQLGLKYSCADYYWNVLTLKEQGGWWISARFILSLCSTNMRYTTRYVRIPVGTGKCVRQFLRAADIPSTDHMWPAGCALLAQHYLIKVHFNIHPSKPGLLSGLFPFPRQTLCPYLFSPIYAIGFVGSFARLLKAPVSFVISVCLCVCLFVCLMYLPSTNTQDYNHSFMKSWR